MTFIIQYDAPISPVWMNENGNWTPFQDRKSVV
jgi:hypothetical protein